MNTRFEYLYRDGGNWKKWGSVVFRGAPSADLEPRLRQACEEPNLFIASQVRLPELFFTEYPVNDDDHCYHEFFSVAATEDEADEADDAHVRSISEFAEQFEQASARWRAFAR